MQLAQVDIGTKWPLAQVPEFQTLGGFVTSLLPKAILIGGIVFFVVVIVSGFQILAGAGSEDAQEKAKWHQILTSAAIGLIIMFAAFWIVQIINFVTGGSLKDLGL